MAAVADLARAISPHSMTTKMWRAGSTVAPCCRCSAEPAGCDDGAWSILARRRAKGARSPAIWSSWSKPRATCGLPEDYIERWQLAPAFNPGPAPETDVSERVIRRVVIRGRVQGVGYRDWTRHVAREPRHRRLGAQSQGRQRRGGVRGLARGGGGNDRRLPQGAAERACRIDRRARGAANVDLASARPNESLQRARRLSSAPNSAVELRLQRRIEIGHRHRQAEIDQAGDAVALLAHAAGHDAARNATGPARH